jgi:hypothetical protein
MSPCVRCATSQSSATNRGVYPRIFAPAPKLLGLDHHQQALDQRVRVRIIERSFVHPAVGSPTYSMMERSPPPLPGGSVIFAGSAGLRWLSGFRGGGPPPPSASPPPAAPGVHQSPHGWSPTSQSLPPAPSTFPRCGTLGSPTAVSGPISVFDGVHHCIYSASFSRFKHVDDSDPQVGFFCLQAIWIRLIAFCPPCWTTCANSCARSPSPAGAEGASRRRGQCDLPRYRRWHGVAGPIALPLRLYGFEHG